MMINVLYNYSALVTSVYDGDTITAEVDLGFHVSLKSEKVRLYGINAPEVRGPEKKQGKISRDWLRNRILGKTVIIKTVKDKKGKYGRYLGTIYLDGVNINEELVAQGLAEFKDY